MGCLNIAYTQKLNSKKKMKFIIHVGLHKTGSTSIQNFCGQNKIWLESNGIYYPSFEDKVWFNHSIPLSLVFRNNHGIKNHSVVSVFDSNDNRVVAANQFLKYFKNEIKQQQSAKNSILLSGEDISIFELDELNIFKEFLFSCGATEIEIILFVRHPIDFVMSGAQELVRAGLFQLGDAMRIGNLQQSQLKIQKLQKVFGKENIKVHNYNLAINGNGIIDYFLSLLGIHSHQTHVINSNYAMGFEKCLMLSALVKIKDGITTESMKKLFDDAGSKIVANHQIYEYLAPLNQKDCDFLNNNYHISWDITDSISKAEIDLNIFDSYLEKLCSYDNAISPATVIMTILEDISDLYPEIAQSISENYHALLRP